MIASWMDLYWAAPVGGDGDDGFSGGRLTKPKRHQEKDDDGYSFYMANHRVLFSLRLCAFAGNFFLCFR